MKKRFLGLAILQLTIVSLSVQALSAQDRREVLSEVTQLRQAGDFATAEEKLRDFVETHPQDSAIALSLGDLLAGSGKVDAALTAWTSMLPRVPPRPDHYVNVARRIRRVGRSELALETLRGGVLAIGDKRPFLWDLAELHMELGHQQDAVTLHLELMRHEPYRLSQITGLLDILALQDAHGDPPVDNRWSQYVETLRASLDPKSREPGPALLLAHALLVSGHPAEGFAILADLTKSRWGDQIELATDGMMRFAQRSEQLGYAQIVIQTYGLLTQMTGDDRYASTSLQRRAQMHIRRGEPAAAIAIYRQLLTTIERPSDIATHKLELATLLQAAGETPECRQILEQLTSDRHLSQRQRAVALDLLVQTGWLLDDFDLVRATLTTLGKMPEGVGEAALGFTELAILTGDFESARLQADRLAAHHPHEAQTNDALQWLLLLDNHIDTPEALQLYALGRHRIRQGRLKDAATHWRQLDEDSVPVLAHQLRLEAGRKVEQQNPAQALGLYEEILADMDLTDRLRFTTTLASARVQVEEGRVDLAVRQLEELLLQLPEDPRAPIALSELQILRQRDEG